MGEPRAELKAALVPVGAMLGTQIAISLAVLALSVLMPAVARDLAVDPKLVGGFTAITYAVAAAIALGSAGAIALQGPHHSAKKSTTTGSDDCSTSCSKLASETKGVAPLMVWSPGCDPVSKGHTHIGRSLSGVKKGRRA